MRMKKLGIVKGIPSLEGDTKWRARQDMHTLKEADDIRHDAKRLEAAAREAQEQVDSLSKIKRMKPATQRKTTVRRKI